MNGVSGALGTVRGVWGERGVWSVMVCGVCDDGVWDVWGERGV